MMGTFLRFFIPGSFSLSRSFRFGLSLKRFCILDGPFSGLSVTIFACREYKFVMDPSKFEALNINPGLGNGRKIKTHEEIIDQGKAQEAGLIKEEIIALQLYTGRETFLFMLPYLWRRVCLARLTLSSDFGFFNLSCRVKTHRETNQTGMLEHVALWISTFSFFRVCVLR